MDSRLAQLAFLLGAAAPATVVVVPPAAFVERAHMSFVAYAGLVATVVAWQAGRDRVRSVRGWIGLGVMLWTILQALKNVEYVAPLPVSADLMLSVLIVAAAGAYRAVLVGRVTWREEIAVYLDAAVVTVTASAAMVVWIAHSGLVSTQVNETLLYAIVFVGIVSATVILDLAVLAELRPRGAYVLLLGVLAIATGFIVRALNAAGGTEHALGGWLISVGVVGVAYGTATWSDVVDQRRR